MDWSCRDDAACGVDELARCVFPYLLRMQHMCNAFIYLCVCVAKRAEKIGFISDPYSMLHSYKDVCLEETDPAKHRTNCQLWAVSLRLWSTLNIVIASILSNNLLLLLWSTCLDAQVCVLANQSHELSSYCVLRTCQMWVQFPDLKQESEYCRSAA